MKPPLKFCDRFCCAYVGGACRTMSGECGWTEAMAVESMEKRQEWMNQELYTWKLALVRATKNENNTKTAGDKR